MVAITFFSGIQLLGMGIVGEYIARIYDESKNRPIYVVKETVGLRERHHDPLSRTKVEAGQVEN